MTYTHFTLEIDSDGHALVTWDSPGKSMNVFTESVMKELDAITDAVVANEAVKGVIITSGKDQFSGGADLTMLERLLGRFHKEVANGNKKAATQRLFDDSRRMSLLYRKIETCGKPWVIAMNGTAVGGACELALACHVRLMADRDDAKFGLPEVKVGLFPGAGGTQRLARMLDTQTALQLLTTGKLLRPSKAKSTGLVDEVVARDQLISTAKARLEAGVDPVKPWDKDRFRAPSGKVYSPAGFQMWPAAGAISRRETHGNYPAIDATLKSVFEGLQVSMDLGLRIESRYFTQIMQTPVAANMIRSLFISMQELNKGARRPKGIGKTSLKKIGILGAGFMGASVAYVTAKAGLDVVLIDQTQEAADKGKSLSDDLISKAISKKRANAADKQPLLDRIFATTDYSALKSCDLVIEAVFEDRDIKAKVTAQAEAVLGEDAIFASNTSTLPITSLAEASKRPDQFVGIHFFSPVDRMMLVEIIKGKETGDRALAVALDYVRLIKKTPIVVNDTRGFFANRSVVNYITEGHLLFMEGVPPAMIETVAKIAGMPVGPLSLTDEVAIDLIWKILQAAKKDLGEGAVIPEQEALVKKMVIDLERFGRKNGKGFYDYPAKGKKHLWPDLSGLTDNKLDPDKIDVEELKQRMLVIQALEAARCVEENVITDVREADVGSILGFGFAPWSGGVLSYIDTMGLKVFVALCNKLKDKHGRRFTPCKLIIDMAEKGETFYGRFPPERDVPDAAEKAA